MKNYFKIQKGSRQIKTGLKTGRPITTTLASRCHCQSFQNNMTNIKFSRNWVRRICRSGNVCVSIAHKKSVKYNVLISQSLQPTCRRWMKIVVSSTVIRGENSGQKEKTRRQWDPFITCYIGPLSEKHEIFPKKVLRSFPYLKLTPHVNY